MNVREAAAELAALNVVRLKIGKLLHSAEKIQTKYPGLLEGIFNVTHRDTLVEMQGLLEVEIEDRLDNSVVED